MHLDDAVEVSLAEHTLRAFRAALDRFDAMEPQGRAIAPISSPRNRL